jgi:hypothetical protein
MTTRVSTARWTGVFYFGLALAGLVGFLFVRSELYVADDATAILANLVDPVPLARFGIAADLTVVLAQALAAIWFFNLFRSDSSFAAGSITAFGLVNAAAIVVATAFSATALVVAGDAALTQPFNCSTNSMERCGISEGSSSACGSSRWVTRSSIPE